MFNIERLDQMIYWSLGGYALTSCVSLGISNFFMALTALLAIVRAIMKCPVLHIPSQYGKPLAAFFAIICFLTLISPDLPAALDRVWRFSFRMIPFVATVLFIKDKKQIRQLITCMLISLTIANMYACWQGLHGDFRAKAFGGHPMDLAGILVQWLPILLVMSLDINWQRQRKYIVTALLIGFAAVLFNGTRGMWLTLALTMPMTLIMYHKATKQTIAYILVSFMAVGVLLYYVPALQSRTETLTDASYQSNSERMLMWQSAWRMFTDYPLTGAGLGAYVHNYQTEYISPQAVERGQGHAHNNFLQMLAETGLVGFSGFCFMFGSFLYYSFRDWQKSHHIASLMFFAATCGIVLQGFTEFNFGNRIVMAIYFFLMALYLQYRKTMYLDKC